MAIIYPNFLGTILKVHDNLQNQIPYPFFDPACVRYEALRTVLVDGVTIQSVIEKFGITDYGYRSSLTAFEKYGTAGLIGLESQRLTESISIEAERMVYVLKKARPWIPATKMVILLQGFDHSVSLSRMRHLYASYGWARGTREYTEVDFWSLNLKVKQLNTLQRTPIDGSSFFHDSDPLQTRLEIFRTLGTRGVTTRYPGSRVSFYLHKKNFLSLGLLGIVDRGKPSFRNSKLGFAEEGRIILSKIQNLRKDEAYYLKILASKKILVGATCLTNIFTRWSVDRFTSHFKGDLDRLLEPELEDIDGEDAYRESQKQLKSDPIRLESGFISCLRELEHHPLPLASPGIFLFLPYLNRLKLFEKVSSLMNVDPDTGYSWFSLLLLNLGRILGGISSVSKSCRISELSLPLMSGLVGMPSKDSALNGIAAVSDVALLQLRRYLTHISRRLDLITGARIAFDFKMRDFTGGDVNLKNIGKGPSPKRKICFPGFRPHIAWDVGAGAPISIEFRNGKARATTTIKRFIRELLQYTLGDQSVEHVYLDSEYTAEHVWKFIVDAQDGLGADLTMCVKRNKRVKKYIDAFLNTNPEWLFFDEQHTYTEQTFAIPIRNTRKILQCVLKRKEANGRLRCFGSTLNGLNSKGILDEYRARWSIENGIKDLVHNYYFDNIPGIEPHRINVHYFVVTLARMLYDMLCKDYADSRNPDNTRKSIGTVRPEFIVGTNAVLSRNGDTLVIKWIDHYPEKQHDMIKDLFTKLNRNANEGIPFLGNLKLKFEIAPQRAEKFYNKMKRKPLNFSH